MKTNTILLTLLLAIPIFSSPLLARDDGSYNLLVGEPAVDTPVILQLAGKRPLKSFLGNPAKKIQKIKGILKGASRQILLKRGYLNDTISEILRNENRIASGATVKERKQLIKANIRLFQRIENIRLQIASIQVRAQQQVLAIETASFQAVRTGVSQQRQRIINAPAAYWIWRRKQLLNETEQGDALPESVIRKYYR